MKDSPKKIAKDGKKKRTWPTVSAVLDDGTLVEALYSADGAETRFAVWKDEKFSVERSVQAGARRLVPYSPSNNLLHNGVVLLPSGVEEYPSEKALVEEVQQFIHAFVDVSPLFEKIASYYVLLSWVYDAFNELPYLRLRGDPGSGKTRFLIVVGSLCYKPIFASGASTVSPLFRILDAVRGTLIIDEGDFRVSDERAEIIKILNNGNARGFPVLRSDVTKNREINPRAYAVFGPKLVATRRYFQDRALESRCLTEEMGLGSLREGIPINLPPDTKDRARQLRNKLLLFRFRTLARCQVDESLVDQAIEPRLNQVFVPLLSVIQDPEARKDLRDLARQYNREIIAERGMEAEAQILEVIRDIAQVSQTGHIGIKDVTSWFLDRFGDHYDRKITPRWVGGIVRRKLFLRTRKSNGMYVIPVSERPKVTRLLEKYGLASSDGEAD